jgi:YVTN family beta-propeller protein
MDVNPVGRGSSRKALKAAAFSVVGLIAENFYSSFLVVLFSLVFCFSSCAQTVTATVFSPGNPIAVSVNPVTNKIYVAGPNGASVTVINGADNSTATVLLPTGNGVNAMAVNPVTNKLYVTGNNVTVINGADNSTASVAAGASPIAVAVNPVTNRIYVANFGSGSVTVMDGASNTTTTVPVGTNPRALAVNPVSNKIYVSNSGSSNVTVIDGSNNSTTTVSVGGTPGAVVVNPVTNKVYVANGHNVTVIDGASNTTTQVAVFGAGSLALNPVTNRIYVTGNLVGITVIDGASNAATVVKAGSDPVAVALNPVTNTVYIANVNSNNITVLDGATNTVTATLASGIGPDAVGVNPVTNRIYVANNLSSTVTVVDGATNSIGIVTDPNAQFPKAVAVNPATDKIYVVNKASNNVTVFTGANETVTAVNVGTNPTALDVNPITNKIYVANLLSANVTVIDGGTNSTSVIPVGSFPLAVAVNPVTNRIYVGNAGSNNVTVIDGRDNSTVTVSDPSARSTPVAIAVDQVTNKIYVANLSNVTVIDGATNLVTTIGIAGSTSSDVGSGAIAVNPVTNKVYIANVGDGGALSPNVTVIDGRSNGVITTVSPAPGFLAGPIAVNPVTNRVYMIQAGTVFAIDGTTNAVVNGQSLSVSNATIAVNATTNKVYAVNNAENYLAVIDAATNTGSQLFAGIAPFAAAANPVTNRLYVANLGNPGNVTVLTEQQVNAIPLTTTISPLPGNATPNPQPTFNFTTTSSYAPSVPAVQNVYYQLDTWQGRWLPATGTAPNFSATLSSLTPGVHILYAYAEDAQEGDSIQPALGSSGDSSPMIGAITAYVFAEVPRQPSDTQLTLTAGTNPSALGQSLTFTATVSGIGFIPTGTIQFMDGNAPLGAPVTLSAASASITTSTLTAGVHSLTAVYSGDIYFFPSTSQVFAEVLNDSGDTATNIALTPSIAPMHTGQPDNAMQFKEDMSVTATVTPSPGTNGTVVFTDGGNVLGSVLVTAGVATLDLTNLLNVGQQRSVQAFYSGGGGFQGSVSSPLFVRRSPRPR